MTTANDTSLEALGTGLARLRGSSAFPDASIVVPVNAQADLEIVLSLIRDLVSYRGRHTFEVLLLVNNFPEEDPPAALDEYERLGMRVVGVPNVWRQGEAVCFSARMEAVRAASCERVISFDADSRIPNPSLLLDWYVRQFEGGAAAAYTHVGHYNLRPLWSVRARIAAHHAARWLKRVVFAIPTTRGSNYAVDRAALLPLYERKLLADDLNVGPALKSAGGEVVYSGARDLEVLTSGRRFLGGWLKLIRYLAYRLGYNVRMIADKDGRRRRDAWYHREPMR
jgi:Glycosyltransferase like family 2